MPTSSRGGSVGTSNDEIVLTLAPDAVAVYAPVRPCGRENLGTGLHNVVEPHAYAWAGRIYFCRGEHATFKRNR